MPVYDFPKVTTWLLTGYFPGYLAGVKKHIPGYRDIYSGSKVTYGNLCIAYRGTNVYASLSRPFSLIFYVYIFLNSKKAPFGYKLTQVFNIIKHSR